MAASTDYDSDPSLKDEEFLEQQSNCWLLEKDSCYRSLQLRLL
jgi:hypothetical protein